MRHDFQEQAFLLDPLTLLLMEEDEHECAEGSEDVQESIYRSGLHRTAPKQSSYDGEKKH